MRIFIRFIALDFFSFLVQFLSKFKKSSTANVKENVEILMNLGKELGDIKFDSHVLNKLVELGNAMTDYEPEHQSPGNLVLIEASESSVYSCDIPEDYNVEKYCTGSVSRHKVSGDHLTFLEEDKVQETATIINQLFQRIRIANIRS